MATTAAEWRAWLAQTWESENEVWAPGHSTPPRSSWSRRNRERAAKMIGLGLMTEPGQPAIDVAKANGTWEVVPDEKTSAITVICRRS